MYNNQKIIALCITELNDEKVFDVVAALNDAINDFGYKLFIYHSYSDFYVKRQNEDGNKAIYDLIHFNIIDAIIIYEESIRNQRVSNEIADMARRSSIPVINIGIKKDSSANFVLNFEAGFEEVVRHIIEYHGIKDTVMIAGREESHYSKVRVDRYKKVLLENGIEFKDSMLYYGDFWSGPASEIVQGLIDENNLPEAIICANDDMAIAAIDTLQKNGFSVPDDIVVTGFDGIKDAQYNNPPITTCRMNHEKMAKDILLAIERLLRGETITEEFYIEQRMEIYSSCGCNIVPDMEFGSMLRVVRDRYARLLENNDVLYEMTERMFALKGPEKIPSVLSQYEMDNCYVFVNDTFFDETLDPAMDKGEKSFSDDLHLIYKFGSDYRDYPIPFKKNDVLPNLDKVLKKKNPIIFASLSTRESPFGFLCIDFEIDIEEYSILPQLTIFLSNALSGYRNIRHLDDLSKRYEKLAEEDFMTGLLNRSGFYKEIDRLKEDTNLISCAKFVVALVDLDGLKKINDNYGHFAGDQGIITVANIIKTIPLENKICVRFGGDEFLICSLCKDEEVAKKVIRNHIFDNLKSVNKHSKNPYNIAVSIGFSSSEGGDIDINNLLMKSDELMYNHKLGKRQKLTAG